MNDIEYLKKYYKGNINDAIKRLENGEPVQYIVGDVDFYGNIIKVDKRVLIPRFETEGLVELAINTLPNANIDIVDLGTGSGCIAITLKKKLPNINIDAVDISESAIELALENAKINNTDINFIHGNMLDNINKKYDCIISNPPYISYNEDVMDIVKNNEPSIALYASDDGLYYYDKILKSAKNNLKENYYIFFEIGYNQGEKIKNIALKYLDCRVEVKKDLQGFDRYIIIKSKNMV